MTIAPEIIVALLKTQAQVGQLGKDDFNAHGKYAFASIDRYYEKVARVATLNGLTWICQCTGAIAITNPGEKPQIRFDYSFDVMHQSGAFAKAAFEHPIIMSLQGAQTAGAALSYADKCFMRHAFHVVTGEEDADATAADLDQDKPKPPPQPFDLDFDLSLPVMRAAVPVQPLVTAPVPAGTNGVDHGDRLMREVRAVATGLVDDKPVLKVPNADSDFALIEEVFVRFVDMCETYDELIGFWNVNVAALDALEKVDAYRHNIVRTRFTARKAVIEKQEAL